MANGTIKGITVEIGGNTAPLDKALKEVNGNSRDLQNELKKVERLLKLDPTNTELLAQKQRLLADTVSETKSKLDILKSAQEQASKAFADGKISEDTYRALQREIIATEQTLVKLEQATQDAAEGFDFLGRKSEKFNVGVQKATLLGASAVATVGVASLKMAGDFEKSTAMVSTLFGDTAVQVNKMDEAILKLSSSTGYAATELGDGLYNALSAGVPVTEDMGEALAFMEKSARLSKGAGAGLGAVVDAQTSIMNAYKLASSDLDRVQKILMQTQNKGKTTVAELSASLSNVTPTAAAMGVSFEQIGASLASMTAQGTPTAQATTQLNALFAELGKSGTGASEAIKSKLGKSFQELMAEGVPLNEVLATLDETAKADNLSLLDMFGSLEAGKAALSLSGDNAEGFVTNLKAMSTETDVVSAAYDKMAGTFDEGSKRAMEGIKNIGIQIGTAIMPYIEKALVALEGLITWISANGETIILWVVVLGTALLALNVVIIIQNMIKVFQAWKLAIMGIQTAQQALNLIMAANPIGLLIAAIAALVAAFIYLWNTNEDFRNFFITLWAELSLFFTETMLAISSYFTEAWTGMWNLLIGFGDFVKNIFTKDWSESFGIFGAILNSFLALFKGDFAAIKAIFLEVIDFVKNIFAGNWEAAWQNILNIFGTIFQRIGAHAKAPLNAVVAALNWCIDKINQFITTLNQIQIELPDIFGGETIGFDIPHLPKIPQLAKGGSFKEGQAIIAEAGPELVQSKNGKTTVTPLSRGAKNTAMGGGDITVNITSPRPEPASEQIKTAKRELADVLFAIPV